MLGARLFTRLRISKTQDPPSFNEEGGSCSLFMIRQYFKFRYMSQPTKKDLF